MLNVKYVRDNLDYVAECLAKKKCTLDKELFLKLDHARRESQTHAQKLREEKKKISRKLGDWIKAGASVDEAKARVASDLSRLDTQLEELAEREETLLAELNQFMLSLPNLPDQTVPEGDSEEHNVEIARKGEPKVLAFPPRDHVDLGQQLGLDFSAGSRLAGSRFVVMRAQMARLHRALAQLMLDIQTDEHGYEECYTPLMVRDKALFGTGQLPKFEKDLFKLQADQQREPYYLIPTSEVTLTNLVADTIMAETELPVKLTAHTPCFRSEAGSYGRDIRGMIRQHQFDKIEMVRIVHPDHSFAALEEMTANATTILDRLELPYRVVSLCGADLGFSAAKTYDIEVWLPAQQCYREIASLSNCLDFQARRMKARFRSQASGKPELVHTLNGSGLAVGRTLVALLENGQDEQGRIHLPAALAPYMGGVDMIVPQHCGSAADR